MPLSDGVIDAKMAAHLEVAFGLEHEKAYGHRAGADEPVELVSIQVVGQGLREGASVPERVRPSRPESAPPPRALVCVACATRAGPWITLNPPGLHL